MTFYYNPKTKQLEPDSDLVDFAAIAPAIIPFSPMGLVYVMLKQFFQPGSLGKDDAKNIETIIKAGKDNGVDEMEIELDREVMQGLDINAFQEVEGINVTLGQKGKSRYRLKVKYKN
ncbi:hypothetical protein [Fischerella sp. PCC 9605]|uniref:hypothetical protein n=1 Tax=Fischerella sp. PCC 9605 TaxID=1173024 RepID=UPI000479B9A7|nr:hypothetical protein [Fischerella sp. PCC 9605]